LFGGLLFLMSALHIVRHCAQPADIWWTPKELGLSLGEASDRVEVYVRGVSLLEQVRSGHLHLVSEAGGRPVTEPEIRLRFNNWDRVRAQGIPVLLGSAVGLGASGVCLLLGILGWIPRRKV
jgi:hypothetical protein